MNKQWIISQTCIGSNLYTCARQSRAGPRRSLIARRSFYPSHDDGTQRARWVGDDFAGVKQLTEVGIVASRSPTRRRLVAALHWRSATARAFFLRPKSSQARRKKFWTSSETKNRRTTGLFSPTRRTTAMGPGVRLCCDGEKSRRISVATPVGPGLKFTQEQFNHKYPLYQT